MKIGATLQDVEKTKRIELIHEYAYVFAWSYQDMLGLDINNDVHKLPLKKECPFVKQNLRRTCLDMALKIIDKLQKQFNVGFLAVAKYSQWIANIVTIPKKDGKV